jgi:hypothetical protein
VCHKIRLAIYPRIFVVGAEHIVIPAASIAYVAVVDIENPCLITFREYVTASFTAIKYNGVPDHVSIRRKTPPPRVVP